VLRSLARHLPKKCTCEASFTLKEPKRRKYLFTFIRLYQKCESACLHSTWEHGVEHVAPNVTDHGYCGGIEHDGTHVLSNVMDEEDAELLEEMLRR
jgi:hypothetical protein